MAEAFGVTAAEVILLVVLTKVKVLLAGIVKTGYKPSRFVSTP